MEVAILRMLWCLDELCLTARWWLHRGDDVGSRPPLELLSAHEADAVCPLGDKGAFERR